MSQLSPALQRLLERLARLHPDDAAAILSELPDGDRAWVVARVTSLSGPRIPPTSSPTSERLLSPWLAELNRSGDHLKPHARAALEGQVAALEGDCGSLVAQPRSLGSLLLAWLKTGQKP